ncbi:MAG: P-loop NTPase [Dehalococcoidia bacterium]|nr:P-loop NTPase [Dehalococcoidia bacterium]
MTRTRGNTNAIKNIQSFNVNLSCVIDPATRKIACERCEKFFDCANEDKWKIYGGGRLSQAREKMASIKYKLAIVGGKGGVGKTALATNLGAELARRGYSVAILDLDFDGSNVPRMMGVAGERLKRGPNGIQPVSSDSGVAVVSLGNVVGTDQIVTWYTESRRQATEELVLNVDYGDRDFLIVDLPPGTSAATVNMMICIPDLTGAVLVTVPSEVSQDVALRASNICSRAGVAALGVVENMSAHHCPHCGHETLLFAQGGGEHLSRTTNSPLLGKVPIDGKLALACEEGVPVVLSHRDAPSAVALRAIVDRLLPLAQEVKRDVSHFGDQGKRAGMWSDF